jgi:hypothetical protein
LSRLQYLQRPPPFHSVHPEKRNANLLLCLHNSNVSGAASVRRLSLELYWGHGFCRVTIEFSPLLSFFFPSVLRAVGSLHYYCSTVLPPLPSFLSFSLPPRRPTCLPPSRFASVAICLLPRNRSARRPISVCLGCALVTSA